MNALVSKQYSRFYKKSNGCLTNIEEQILARICIICKLKKIILLYFLYRNCEEKQNIKDIAASKVYHDNIVDKLIRKYKCCKKM